MQLAVKILTYIVIIYFSCLVLLFLFQRNLMYRPDANAPILTSKNKQYYSEEIIQTSDGLKLLAWYARANNDKPTIVYFHGNAGNIADRTANLKTFIDNDFGLLLLSYRGYGGNQGDPFEIGLYKDARAAIKFLLAQGIPLDKLIIFGESLGTGVAVQMATEYETKMLILQSPYTNMVEIASTYYPLFPVKWLLKDHYDSLRKIPQLSQRIIIIHGLADQVVPATMGKKLYGSAKNAELFTLQDAGHGDILTLDIAKKIIDEINIIYE